MSTITKSLQGFIFNGAALALASAAFKSNINVIIGFNASGTGYVSYRPTSTFNSLTQLQQDGVYIVDAKTTGFDILGAALTAVSGLGTGPLSVNFYIQRNPDSGVVSISPAAYSTDSEDTYFLVSYDKGTAGVVVVHVDDPEGIPIGIFPVGEVITAKLINRNGNTIIRQLTVPNGNATI